MHARVRIHGLELVWYLVLIYRAIILVIIFYFLAAVAGFVKSVGADFPRFPPGDFRRLRSQFDGWRWPISTILFLLLIALIIWNITLVAAAYFIFSSPLFAYRLFCDVLGRKPEGRIIDWYVRIAQRRQMRPPSCRL